MIVLGLVLLLLGVVVGSGVLTTVGGLFLLLGVALILAARAGLTLRNRSHWW